jgi:hypothetical protein
MLDISVDGPSIGRKATGGVEDCPVVKEQCASFRKAASGARLDVLNPQSAALWSGGRYAGFWLLDLNKIKNSGDHSIEGAAFLAQYIIGSIEPHAHLFDLSDRRLQSEDGHSRFVVHIAKDLTEVCLGCHYGVPGWAVRLCH